MAHSLSFRARASAAEPPEARAAAPGPAQMNRLARATALAVLMSGLNALLQVLRLVAECLGHHL